MRRYRAPARPRAIRCTGSVTLRDETSQRTFTEPPSIARRIECDSGAAMLGHTEMRAFPEPQNHARLRIITHRSEGAGPAGMPVSHPMRGARPHEARPWGSRLKRSRMGTLLKSSPGGSYGTREHANTR